MSKCKTCGGSGEKLTGTHFDPHNRNYIPCPDCNESGIQPDTEENINIAGEFIRALGWHNAHVNYREDMDKFVLMSASSDPIHEKTFNELYSVYKDGYKSRQPEIDKLNEAVEEEMENVQRQLDKIESMRNCLNCTHHTGLSGVLPKKCRGCIVGNYDDNCKINNWKLKQNI